MFTGDDEIYQERTQDYYEEPYHRGRCPNCTHAHKLKNELCGDEIRVELQIDDRGTVKEVYFNGAGCCISEASASMLLERLDGKTVEDVKKFTARDMLDLFGARLTPNRQKCCLLSWRVLQAAIYSPVQVDGALACGAAVPAARAGETPAPQILPPTKEGTP